MDAITPKTKQFLPALAEQIALWFPELSGRALPVSEVTITKENVPTLPLVMVAFTNSMAEPPSRTQATVFDMVDTFIVEFWLQPERYKKANGAETPFWSFYPYEDIRDTLLANIAHWESPNGERISFRRLQLGADPFAVTLTFTFVAMFRWCAPIPSHGEPFTLNYSLCTPSPYDPGCDPCEPICEPVDPCEDPNAT
jgi:hypothetical protein